MKNFYAAICTACLIALCAVALKAFIGLYGPSVPVTEFVVLALLIAVMVWASGKIND